jgi:hypothetical protein
MTGQLTPKYCPQCGQALSSDRQGTPYCVNKNCVAFGIAVNLKVEQAEIKVGTPDQPLNISDRQFTILLNSIQKDSPISDWRMLQHISHRQLQNIAKCQAELCQIEIQLKNTPMTNEEREKALANLIKIGVWLESKGNFASTMNEKAFKVVTAAYEAELAQKRVEQGNAELIAKAYEETNA